MVRGISYGTLNWLSANVPTVVVTLTLMTSPDRTLVSVEPAVVDVKVNETDEPFAIPFVATLLLAVHVPVEAVVAAPLSAVPLPADARVTEPLNPLFDEMPVMVTLPKLIATAPTFRTSRTILQLGLVPQFAAAEGVNVPSSTAMLDYAAWFCAPCCPPVELDVWLRDP